MHLSVEECLTATTVNAAAVLKRDSEYGTIEPGKKADMVVFDAPSFSYIPYHFGENHARTVVKHGLVMDTA
jgi:imidazolonepropionase